MFHSLHPTRNPLHQVSLLRPQLGALLPTFWGEVSPTKIDYSKKGTLILFSLLEDLDFGGLVALDGS